MVSENQRKNQDFCWLLSMPKVNNNKSRFFIMKRKNTQTAYKTAWQLAWELRKYPAQLDEAKRMTRADTVFCLMLWLGMSKVDAYLTAYPTRASRNSVSAMATRRSQELWVTEYLNRLSDLWYNDQLKFK